MDVLTALPRETAQYWREVARQIASLYWMPEPIFDLICEGVERDMRTNAAGEVEHGAKPGGVGAQLRGHTTV